MLSAYQQLKIRELIHYTFLKYTLVEIAVEKRNDDVIALTAIIAVEQEVTCPLGWKALPVEGHRWVFVRELPIEAYQSEKVYRNPGAQNRDRTLLDK